MSLFGPRSDGARERTPEEREQARREREARRRARAGGAPAELTGPDVREERIRAGRRAGVVDAPQRRIRVEDPPPEAWDERPEIHGHSEKPDSLSAILEDEASTLDREPFFSESEPYAVEPEPSVSEPEEILFEPEPAAEDEPEPLRFEPEPAVDEEREPIRFEPEPAAEDESGLLRVEPEPAVDEEREPIRFEPEPAAEDEPEPLSFEPDPSAGDGREALESDSEPFSFDFEPPPRPAGVEPAGSNLEPHGPNGRFSASDTAAYAEAEPEPPSRRREEAAPVVEREEAPASTSTPGPGPTDDGTAPVAPPLPPRLKRFRQERMEPSGKRASARRARRKALPAPRPPRRVAKAAEERADPEVRRWIARALVPLILVGLLFLGWFMVSLYQPFTGDGGEPIRVQVPNGLSAREIGALLADRGVVDSGFFFALRARAEGHRESLKAGTYTFNRDMSYVDAMAILRKGPPPIRTVTLTLPEGNTVRDFAGAVDDSKKVKGSYMRAVKRARLNPARYGAPRGAPLEGFLFPATYEYRTGRGTAADLVADQLQAFKRTMRGISMRPARRAGLTPYEVLIIASMVERETSVARERKVIAGVIYNRLRQGIPLGIDATIRYATNNWKRPIRQSELDAPGPYNTRKTQGLPPTPIGNPGLASIKAAANPKRTPYLFFVVKPGGDGEHAFSRTDAEFQRDVARYNTARDARGGRDPR